MAEQNVYRCKVSEPKNVIAVYEIRAASQEEADRIAEEKYHKAFSLKQKVINPMQAAS